MAEIPPPSNNTRSGILFLMQMQGGLIRTAELAVKIGEALCEEHYRKEELARQQPLFAVDKDTYWRVEGSWNRDGQIPGNGNFYLSIEKYDGRVIDFGLWFRNPEGDAFLQRLMNAKTPEEKNEIIAQQFQTGQDLKEKKD